MAIAYGVISLIALALIVVCYIIDRKRDKYLLLLCVSVFVVNAGYFMLSVSKSLTFALVSNAISYLGSVFLPFFLLMMILNLCNIKYPKWLVYTLLSVGGAMLFVSITPGWLPIYYKTVSFQIVDGVGQLDRTYGPLHIVYAIYLIGYFATMLGIVIYGIAKKKIKSPLHATLLLSAVLINLAIWLVEQFIERGFENLSVSYLSTEVFVLLVYGMLQQYGLIEKQAQTHKLREDVESGYREQDSQNEEIKLKSKITQNNVDDILKNPILETLTKREMDVLKHILLGEKRKEIASELCVSESAVRNYTSQIFKKLEVLNRVELFIKLLGE